MGRITIPLIISTSAKQKKRKEDSQEELLSRLTHLHLGDKGIEAIENLHYCPNVQVLYLFDNQIEKIQNLSFAESLSHLYLQNNNISKLENISSLTRLTKLYLNGNCISTLEGLEGLHCLEELQLSNQRLPPGTHFTFSDSSLASIAGSLQLLTLANNSIRQCSPLKVLRRLQLLDISGNQIDDISDVEAMLAGCQRLQTLDTRGNPACATQKNRDKIILACISLDTLDGREITSATKEFLVRKREKKEASRKPAKARRDSADENGVVEDC